MKISKVAIHRPITTVMFMLIVIMFGIVSLSNLPVDFFPNITFPMAIVSTQYEGTSPKEMETLVTKPMESVLGMVSNLKDVTSTSSNGSSTIVLEFEDDTNMDFAMLDIREKIDLIKGYLPEGVSDPTVFKLDPNMMPILRVGVSGNYDLAELKNILDDEVIQRFERIEGVASVYTEGSKEREVKVTLYPDKMNGYGINISTLSQILQAENLNLPVGDIKRGSKEVAVRCVGEFETLQQIRNLPIPTAKGIIYLRDIAVIEDTFQEMNSYAFIDKKPSIFINVQKQSTANTVKVGEKLSKELKEIQQKFPNLTFKVFFDQAETININIGTVKDSAYFGGILALIVLFLFLRNIRSTIIIGIAIPFSIIVAFLFMYFFGITINIISLGGLTLGIGMLVDNSIVVLENIYRHRMLGDKRQIAAYKGVSEVGMAVLASTLTTIAVFVPMLYAKGIVAKIFRDMSLTITFSLVASLIVAITVVPMMAGKILKVETCDDKCQKRLTSKILDWWGHNLQKIDSKYRKLLNYSLHHRKRTTLIASALFITSLLSIPAVGVEYMTKTDQGQFQISIEMPKGTVIEETLQVTEQVEEVIRTIEEVKQISVSVGSDGQMFSSSSATSIGNMTVDVGSVDERKRSTKEIVEEARIKLKGLPGVNLAINEITSSGGPPTSAKAVTLLVKGDNLDKLEAIAGDITKHIRSIEGTREVTNSLESGKPEAVVSINRNKTSLYGLNMASIANALQGAVSGKVATKYKVDGDEMDVRIIYDPSRSQSINDLLSISIPTPTGGRVPLTSIAKITEEQAPLTIDRMNNSRYVRIESDILGVDLGTVQKQIVQYLDTYQFPEGYSYEFSGDVKEMVESFASLGLALIMSVFLIYMVLAAQFESFIHPFTIMFSVPISLTGGIFALLITGRSLNINGFIGLIMLVGIVVNNAIVLVDYINQLIAEGKERSEAILEAGPTRLRPILMTTLTTVLAMVPMAIGIGEGSETMTPLATVIIGGLTLSTLLTLVIIPVNYTIFDDFRLKILKKFKKVKNNTKELAN